MEALATSFLAAIVPLFVLVDPVAGVPLFISLTRAHTRLEAASVAKRASIAGAAVLVGAALLGPGAFELLRIDPAAFRAAGGGLLLLLAIDMLRNKPKTCACSADELDEARDREDIAIVPLAVPMLSGPGAIAAVIVMAEDAQGGLGTAGVIAAIVTIFVATYAALRFAVVLKSILGSTGLALMERLMGLVVAALAVQLIVHGVQALLG